jgi:hypothetical protein
MNLPLIFVTEMPIVATVKDDSSEKGMTPYLCLTGEKKSNSIFFLPMVIK